ncbi:DUF485 domain-containing protein [Streptomyces sp. OF8]|uniref:DUF485 domain-containing protein n=4 Tax=Streptomyces alkaliterrae TaxID=2213162 RepID=A0A7W3X1I0_9ACTN|nr:DUF485 domain-containing protein [Streptomyces alkaliterrae]
MSTQTRPHPDPPEGGGTLSDRSVDMHDDPRFRELRRRLLVFVFPMSAAFFSWYLLYVLMSAYARDTMATVLFGQVNLALVFGVLQFVTTFGIAVLYARYAARRLDPLAGELCEELDGGTPDTAADTVSGGINASDRNETEEARR